MRVVLVSILVMAKGRGVERWVESAGNLRVWTKYVVTRLLYALLNVLCDVSTSHPCGAREWLVTGCELGFTDRIMEPVEPQANV